MLSVSPIVDYYENGLPYDGMWFNPVDVGYHGRFMEPGIQLGRWLSCCLFRLGSEFYCCLFWAEIKPCSICVIRLRLWLTYYDNYATGSTTTKIC